MAAPVDHPLSWNKTTTSAFIDVLKLQLHECLWNIKSESYKNRDLRRAAFRSIIDEFEKKWSAHHQSSDSVNASTGDQGGK